MAGCSGLPLNVLCAPDNVTASLRQKILFIFKQRNGATPNIFALVVLSLLERGHNSNALNYVFNFHSLKVTNNNEAEETRPKLQSHMPVGVI